MMEPSHSRINIQGVSPGLGAEVVGLENVLLGTMMDGKGLAFVLEDVLHVPGAQHELLAPGVVNGKRI
ncbi:TPA: hypothetical protein N0F65_012365 [Lagenidium giganteum]|uniref:Uncharacterized protein n=1 Tax=Lagenidium giganteum TaxID=4803 RepID=A0AAV2YQA5_9STRA|nr:TPA: hypothetical protein N0F65_012365 [Lagenidium giganteum]